MVRVDVELAGGARLGVLGQKALVGSYVAIALRSLKEPAAKCHRGECSFPRLEQRHG